MGEVQPVAPSLGERAARAELDCLIAPDAVESERRAVHTAPAHVHLMLQPRHLQSSSSRTRAAVRARASQHCQNTGMQRLMHREGPGPFSQGGKRARSSPESRGGSAGESKTFSQGSEHEPHSTALSKQGSARLVRGRSRGEPRAPRASPPQKVNIASQLAKSVSFLLAKLMQNRRVSVRSRISVVSPAGPQRDAGVGSRGRPKAPEYEVRAT